jgi:predicted nucleotidyltransferase component of viral defense system
MLFISAISSEALELLKEVQGLPILNDFYLVGGTALSLRYGHRISVDLDFFTDKEFDTNSLIDTLRAKYNIRVLSQAKNSLTLDLRSVKTDFIRHNYPLLKPVVEAEKIRMASVEDIAAMKLNSMMNRGSKKDFYDIYELLNHFTLPELISFYTSKYDFSSQFILLKSLVYFDDAEPEPDPVSIKPTSWNLVKQKISEAVCF